MDNQTFQRIKDLITQHQAIGVVVRPNPSLDEMAGGLGMYLVLNQMGKSVSIACSTNPVVGLSSLVGIQKVGKSLGEVSGKGGNLTVSFPYKEGEIEKVSYTQENGQLNILVQAGPSGLSFNKQDINFTQLQAGGTMPTLLFAIGVPNLNDVSSVVSPDTVSNMTIVNIDNKENNAKYGDVAVVSSRFSSVSEQVADFLTLLEPQIELDKDTSQNLFDGISFATKDYSVSNTSYLAFEMAGILMKKGATRYKAPGASVPQGQPTSQYFPPVNNQPSPVQQPPVSQSQPSSAPNFQQFNPGQFNPSVIPNQQFNSAPLQTQPAQPSSVPPQNLGEQSQAQSGQAPADWLTPKVYKGSSIL